MAKSDISADSAIAGTSDIDTNSNDESNIESSADNGSDAGVSERDTSADSGTENPSELGNPTIGVNPRTRKRSGGSASDNGTSGKSRTQSKKPVDLNRPAEKIFAQQLVGAHKILGLVAGNAALWEITNEQGAALSDAILEVMNQYKIKPNPKVVAWMNLIGVCSVVYGTKLVMYKAIVAAKRANHKQPEHMQRESKPVESAGFQMQYN